MKLFVILFIIVGGMGSLTWYAFNKIKNSPVGQGLQNSDLVESEEDVVFTPPHFDDDQEHEHDSVSVPDIPSSSVFSVEPFAIEAFEFPLPPIAPPRELVLESGHYIFKNRNVPPVPNEITIYDRSTLLITADEETNSWVWSVADTSKFNISEFAKSLDLAVSFKFYDLDFVFVSVSQEYVNSLGIGAMFNEGAFLNTFDAFFSAQGLQLTYNGFSSFLDFEKNSNEVRIVSSPTIRCQLSNEFEFSTLDRIPITNTEVVNNVPITTTQFVDAGFSISGTLLPFSDDLRLDFVQRNGVPVVTDSATPTIDQQTLRSSADLKVSMWTLLGGVKTSRLIKNKGFLSRSESHSDDLLYIFVRPRDRVKPIPRAIVIDDPHSIIEDSQGLLPLPLDFSK